MAKVLVKGNEAIAQAAINAGCQCYFGYPITPQSEIGEYMGAHLPEMGRNFITAESELASINMVIGAGTTGTKAMTSSSSCGIALMQEAISAMCCAEVPGVIVSVMRGGPGLGNIAPAQGDYFQAVKGGGNGDYKTIVLSPSTVQEAIDLTYRAFYLSLKYRNPVMLLADGLLGQMMEPVEMPEGNAFSTVNTDEWALDGTGEGAQKRDGRSLMTFGPAAPVKKCFSNSSLFLRSSYPSFTSRPIISPRPRYSFTGCTGFPSGHRACLKYSPTFAAFSTRCSLSIISITAMAAAQAR